MSSYTFIGPIRELLTFDTIPLKGAIRDDDIPLTKNAGLLIHKNRIHKIGDYNSLLTIARELKAAIVNLSADYVCLPGFIDAHTHICFAGNRAKDYALRNSGKTYLEIAEAGGGIWDTVTHTRNASLEELVAMVSKRANRMLERGVTTIEVKSGYGLSVKEELKILRAIKQANDWIQPDLIATCLAAHMLPKDFKGNKRAYLEEIAYTLFPILKREKLTNRIDGFIEETAFSGAEIAPYFSKATAMGFDITVHADQFTTGGSEIAIHVNAISADHLEASTYKEIIPLANSNVIATALPGASIGLGCSFTPARKILDAGGTIAIASDWNPGSAPMGDLLTQACILGAFEKLSNAEVLAGITHRAAAALGLGDRGVIKQGMIADFLLFPAANYQEILYHQGQLLPAQVWKNGMLIFK